MRERERKKEKERLKERKTKRKKTTMKQGRRSSFAKRTAVDDAKIKRNEHGGIAVDEAELKAAFEFFDVSGSGKITLSDLKNRLGAFYKNVPLREYKFLMNNQSELTLDDLRSLLENNEIKNFDPVAEAFRVYDPSDTGYVDTSVLRGIFEKLGFGTIT